MTGNRMARPLLGCGWEGSCDARSSEDAFRPLKGGDVHFGYFFYGRLDIAKVRQEHFALKRRVRFCRHVVAVVDTLDQAYLDQTLQFTPDDVARHFEIARQLAQDHRALEGVPNEDL